MSTITIKKFPEALLDQLRERAVKARRSVTQEVIATLEGSFAAAAPRPIETLDLSEPTRQVEAWAALAGKWQSDLTVQEEVEQLYRARRSRKTPAL